MELPPPDAVAPRRSSSVLTCGTAPIYVVIASAVAFLFAVILLTTFRYDVQLNVLALVTGWLAAAGIMLRRVGLARIGMGIEAIAQFTAFGILAPLCAAVLASSNLPLVDAYLERADAILFFGFSRTRFVQSVEGIPHFMDATRWIYHSLLPQPYILIACLTLTGRSQALWTLMLAWGLAFAITLAAFPFFPAVGSPPYFFSFLDVFNGARDGSLRVLGPGALTGIITFPSFHAAAAVILGWGWYRLRPLGWAGVVLNALMFFSALIAGHYLVDLIAGGFVAVLAIGLAGRIQRRHEQRRSRTSAIEGVGFPAKAFAAPITPKPRSRGAPLLGPAIETASMR